MPTRKELLKNLSNFSAEEIADAVKHGVVSLYDLGKESEGAFTPLLKRRVKELLDQTSIVVAVPNKENSINNTVIADLPDEDTAINEDSNNDIVETLDIIEESSPMAVEETKINLNSESKPRMFKKPFSFNGRIRRTEYGISMIICFFVNMFMQGLLSIVEKDDSAAGLLLLYFILLIPYFWFVWAQGAKRCHDRGNSGWFQIIPFYGFWMLFAEGDAGINEYGNSPK